MGRLYKTVRTSYYSGRARPPPPPVRPPARRGLPRRPTRLAGLPAVVHARPAARRGDRRLHRAPRRVRAAADLVRRRRVFALQLDAGGLRRADLPAAPARG